jgi:hypothetical protein
VPKGWRQSRVAPSSKPSTELYSRIREHARNIEAGAGLELSEFSCRFVIFEDLAAEMISTVEAALIKINRPLWNSVVDGFGNHTPGAGRFEQARSDWDVVHPGRAWAKKCKGAARKPQAILKDIRKHFEGRV